jgi:hypothetical protein
MRWGQVNGTCESRCDVLSWFHKQLVCGLRVLGLRFGQKVKESLTPQIMWTLESYPMQATWKLDLDSLVPNSGFLSHARNVEAWLGLTSPKQFCPALNFEKNLLFHVLVFIWGVGEPSVHFQERYFGFIIPKTILKTSQKIWRVQFNLRPRFTSIDIAPN